MPGQFRQVAPIGCIFAAHGLVLGAWATQVPLLRDRLHVDPAALGGALFCISAGALAMMPLTSKLAARFGPRAVIGAGSTLACAAFVAAAISPDYAALCLALLAFGMGFGTVDVAMNAASVRIERLVGRHILGGVHAMWSIGAAGGAIGGALLLGVTTAGLQAAVLGLFSVSAILLAASRLGSAAEAEAASLTHKPWRDRGLLRIGLILCVGFAVEGAIADWGGIYLHSVRHIAGGQAALGYAAFSAAMVAMRLAGDRVRCQVGNAGMLIGAFAAALGIGLVLFAPGLVLSILGFAVVGLGAANVVPALFALAGSSHAAHSNAAIGVVATIGYAGVLAGPPLFGAVAQATALPAAIGLIGVLCCVIGLCGLKLRRSGVAAPPRNHTVRHCS